MQTSVFRAGIGLWLVLASAALAAESQPSGKPGREKTKASVRVTAEQEAEVLQFLKQHHAELADLLQHLRPGHPTDYDRAIRDVWRALDRLRQVKKGDGARYELELQSWVIQSKIELLAARLALDDRPALHDELRALLVERLDLRVRTIQSERQRAAERLRRADEQLQRLTDKRADILERELATVTSSTERLKAKRQTLLEAKPAGKKARP